MDEVYQEPRTCLHTRLHTCAHMYLHLYCTRAYPHVYAHVHTQVPARPDGPVYQEPRERDTRASRELAVHNQIVAAMTDDVEEI